MSADKTYTIFDEETRKCVGRITCSAKNIKSQIKAGQIAIKGSFDKNSTRLDDDGRPVTDAKLESDYMLQRQRTVIKAKVAELERKQHRRVRELLMSSDDRLKKINDDIYELRKIIGEPGEL